MSLLAALPLLLFCGLIRSWNIAHSPGGWNDDEGTYAAQAWALTHDNQLAHYTYWYDHPPFGWMQIAVWAWLTRAFERNDVALVGGRELLAAYAVIGSGLVYLLCRRLGMIRVFSAAAMVLYMLCPIMQVYGNMLFLDALTLPWVLAALVCATYAKNHYAALWAGVFIMGAGLTKETTLAFAPVVFWMVWQHSHWAIRVRNVVMSIATMIGVGSFYPLLSVLKGELLPGEGHVSLVGALKWQLGGRGGSGSVLDTTSLSFQWFERWMALDKYLLAAAVPMLIVVLTRRVMWPIALAGAIHLVLLLRNGYLPIPFVTILIPIAALLVAGGLDVLWKGCGCKPKLNYLVQVLSVVLTLAFAITIAPSWYGKTDANLHDHSLDAERAAVAWVVDHVPPSAGKRFLVDDNVWLDLVMRGYPRDHVDWLYKVDADPAITPHYIPEGGTVADTWQMVDIVIIPPLDKSTIESVPTLDAALQHAHRVADLTIPTPGSYSVYEVQH